MLFENSDDKKKRNSDAAIYNASFDSEKQLDSDVDGLAYEPFQSGLDAMKERTSKKLETLAAPLDSKSSNERFKNSFGNYMLPKDTPQRRRQQYSLSQSALDDVTGDFYEKELKGNFEKRRDESKRRGREEYMRYVSVPGMAPEDAYRASLRADNPMNVVDETINAIDNEKLVDKVSTLASYGGYDPEEYVENYVKPTLRDKMIGEYVKEETPKSRGEYILRSAVDNSLFGKVSSIGLNSGAGNSNYRKLAAEGLAGYDAEKIDDFVSGVGSLLIDAPFFRGFGGRASWLTGKATKAATKRIASEVIDRSTNKYMNKRFAENIARRVITQRLGNRILQSSSVQGLTLGSYDIANSVADDILYNSNVNVGKAAGAFARGAATGVALGAVGTPLKKMSEGLTGGKKLLSSAGVLSAESAVFTAGGELEKLAHGVEITPVDLLYDFSDSAATLLVMRMANWRPLGAAFKLGPDGFLIDDLNLSPSERQEVSELRMNPDQLVRAIERELRLPSFGGANAEYVKQSYAKLMSNRKLSASLKSKLMLLVENKVTATPPAVFDYKAMQKNNGTWKVELLDANGGLVERKDFPNAGNVKSFIMVESANIRRNRILYFEKELTDGLNSQNFLRQAGIFAKERGVDVNRLAEAMFKSANKEALTETEERMINEVLSRSSYSAPGMVQELYNTRRAIEKRHGLEEGRLLSVIDEKFFMCTPAENRALNDYEAYVRSEVNMLKKGTNADRVLEMYDSGLSSMFFGYSNDQVKLSEVNKYKLELAKRYEGQGGSSSVPRQAVPTTEGLLQKANQKSSTTPEEIENYRKRADELSGKFGFELNYITDKSQIALPDTKDYNAVMEYENQLDALGWQHKGRIFINLPNIKNYNDLETTVVHEAVAHGGLRKVFGYRLYDFLEEVYRRADKSVLDGISRTKSQYYGADAYTVIEEYLAKIVEKAYPNARERSIVARFKDFIKSALIKLNIYTDKNRKISEQELETLMQSHCRYVMKKKGVESHRKDVFGRFGMAHKDAAGYYDKNAYGDEMRELLKDDAYMKNTPEYILPYKTLLKYPYFSEEKKRKIREAFGMTDEEIAEQLDGYYYRFIGEKGARNLKRSNWDRIPELSNAEELERNGFAPDYIKFTKGWERGADGMWRYEVAEKDMYLNDYIAETLEKSGSGLSKLYSRLKQKPYAQWNENDKRLWNSIYSESKQMMEDVSMNDILQDFNLYEAYPEFANIPVRIVANAPYVARYDNKNREVILDRRFFVMPNADAYLSGTIQNMIQHYEGFGKAISLRLASVEKKFENNYKMAQDYLAVLNQDDYVPGKNGKKNLLREIFKSEFGVSPEQFKERFPTYNDYLFYKLTGKNMSFSGNVEAENVRKRFSMSPYERRLSMASETEMAPRDRQLAVRSLAELENYFTGPLDVINKNLREHYTDRPFTREFNLFDNIDYSDLGNVYRLYNTYNVYDDERPNGTSPYKDLDTYFNKRINWGGRDYEVYDDEYINKERKINSKKPHKGYFDIYDDENPGKKRRVYLRNGKLWEENDKDVEDDNNLPN